MSAANGNHARGHRTSTRKPAASNAATEASKHLSSLIRPPRIPRISLNSVPSAYACAVWEAFGLDPEQAPDNRIRGIRRVEREQYRGYPIEPPPACLVRTPRSRSIILVVRFLPNEGAAKHKAEARPIAQFYADDPKQLPRDPELPTKVLTTEAMARCFQVWRGLSDKEAVELYVPMQPERFRDTVVEPVTVEAVAVDLHNSPRQAIWIRYPGELIHSVGLVGGAPLRPAKREYVREIRTPSVPL